MKQQSAAPTAKVWAATLAALVAPILLGLLAKAFPDIPLPVDANDLAQQVIQGLVIAVVTFLAGYMKSPGSNDETVPK